MTNNITKRETAILMAMEEALPALRAFARGLCLDRMSADDLVQAACERALERIDQVTDIVGVKSWLNRIVYTQWQDTLRRRGRRHSKLLQFSSHQINSAGRPGSDGERARSARMDVEKALSMLSPDARVAVVLVGMLGYSYQEAGTVLGMPAGTVASRAARARSQLADILTADERRGKKMTTEKWRFADE